MKLTLVLISQKLEWRWDEMRWHNEHLPVPTCLFWMTDMLHYFSVGSCAMVIMGYGLVKICRHLCGSQRFPQYTLFSALENLTINSYGGHTCNRMTWCYVCFAVWPNSRSTSRIQTSSWGQWIFWWYQIFKPVLQCALWAYLGMLTYENDPSRFGASGCGLCILIWWLICT